MAIDTGNITQLPELSKINYSALDFDTLKAEIIQYIKENYPDEQNDFLETNTGIMIIDILSYIGDVLSYRADFLANENYLSTARTKKAIIRLLELTNYRLGRQSASIGDVACTLVQADQQLLTISGALTKDIIISSEDDRTSISTEDDAGEALTFEIYKSAEDLTSSVIIPAGTVIGNTINAIMIEGGSTVDRFIADINNAPNQSFPLSEQNALDTTLIVTVNGVLYTRVDNLAYENGATRAYVVTYDENNNAELQFGDNVFGAIPPKGAEIVAFYRYGGGKRGNIIKGNLNVAQSFVIDGRTVTIQFTNSTATTGGSDEETITHAKNYAPKAFKTQVRAVTGEDYSVFASGYTDGTNGSIAKAIATLRPYLALYAGNIGSFSIDQSNNNIRLRIANNTLTVALNTGSNISLLELIDDINTKIATFQTNAYEPPIEASAYTCRRYRYIGTIPDAGQYVITNTNYAFKVRYGLSVYTANIPLGTYTMAQIVDILNASFDTGDNVRLRLFRAMAYYDRKLNKTYLSVIATAKTEPSITAFELVNVGSSAYAQFGLSPTMSLTLLDEACLVIQTKYHDPQLTLEAIEVSNPFYNDLGLAYSTGTNGLGKAYPCGANYIDIHALSEGTDGSLVPPSDALKSALRDFLTRFKQITDEVVVWDGGSINVDVIATITITRGYRKELIDDSVTAFFDEFFNPDNNDFGLPLYISKIYEGVENIVGVNHAVITDIKVNGVSQLTTGNKQVRNVVVGNNEIWTKGQITLTYDYSRL
jgi:hypothetical protein